MAIFLGKRSSISEIRFKQLIPRALKFQGNSSQTLQIYNC